MALYVNIQSCAISCVVLIDSTLLNNYINKLFTVLEFLLYMFLLKIHMHRICNLLHCVKSHIEFILLMCPKNSTHSIKTREK